MNYRKIEISDIDRLIILRKSQMIDEGFSPINDIDNEIRKYFKDNIEDETFFGWVAVDNNDIVSTAGACIMKRPPSFTNPTGELVYVTNVYTKDDMRNGYLFYFIFFHSCVLRRIPTLIVNNKRLRRL